MAASTFDTAKHKCRNPQASGIDGLDGSSDGLDHPEVRAWLAENVPADLKGRGFASSRADVREVNRLREWQRALHKAGYVGMDWPAEYGGRDASNLEMAIIREHLATKGLGLHNDLQNEHSVVGNFPIIVMLRDFGSPAQKEKFIAGGVMGRCFRNSFMKAMHDDDLLEPVIGFRVGRHRNERR